MDKQEEFEQKQKALKKRFSKQFSMRWLLFLAYNVVADTVLYFIRNIISYPLAVVAVIVSTGLSFYITLKAVTELKHIKNEQENRLRQEAPMGKFRL